jgi:hypothetical protein
MQISEFLTGYSNIINETYTKKEIDDFFQKMIPLTKDTSSEIQCYIADSTLEKVLAIDDIAYKFMGREVDLLGQMFPESDETDVQNQLFFLTGKNITELQKGSRKYFAPILSGLDFLTKQVGKTTKEDISKELNSYNILFEAQMKDPNTIILSNAELITLYRALKDQKYKALMDERGLDESSDINPLVVAGYGSVELVDREGHLITLNALRKSFVKFMKNFRMRNCMYLHTDVQVGWPLPVYINKHNEIFKSGVDDKGLYLITEVSPEGKISEKVRDGIIKGELKSYSIAGSALKKQIMTKGSQTFMQVDDLELSEYTLCTQGVNQDSKFDIMKAIKNEKDSLDNTNRDDPLMDGLDIPTVTEEISRSVAKSIGNKIGADWNKYTPSEFAKGLNAEMAQKDVTRQDLFSIARLALSNLEDTPKYYSLLSGKLKKSLASKSALDIRESSSDYNYDASALREAIIAEYDATNLYEQMAEKTKDEKLKALLLDIANEEKVHIGEFEAKLAEIDEEHESAVEEGEEEAKDIMKSAIDRFSSFMRERK